MTMKQLQVKIKIKTNKKLCFFLLFFELQRDIERDIVVINGIKVNGSIGLQEVINRIENAIDEAFDAFGLKPFSKAILYS